MNISRRLARKIPKQLLPEEWTSAVRLGFQQQVVTYLLWVYGGLLTATLTIIFFQGFHLAGFALNPVFLNWLGGATIGEIGGLLVIALRASFK